MECIPGGVDTSQNAVSKEPVSNLSPALLAPQIAAVSCVLYSVGVLASKGALWSNSWRPDPTNNSTVSRRLESVSVEQPKLETRTAHGTD